MIVIKQEAYFPAILKVLGVILLIFGVLTVLSLSGHGSWVYALFGLLACLIGLIFLTTHYYLELDPVGKRYREGVRLLGHMMGAFEQYQAIDKVFVNRVLVNNTMTSHGGRVTSINKTIYKAFIKFDNGKKIPLDLDKDEGRLNARIAVYQKKLLPQD